MLGIDLLTPGVIIGACSLLGSALVFIRSRKKDKAAEVDQANSTVFEGYSELLKRTQADNQYLRREQTEIRKELADTRAQVVRLEKLVIELRERSP